MHACLRAAAPSAAAALPPSAATALQCISDTSTCCCLHTCDTVTLGRRRGRDRTGGACAERRRRRARRLTSRACCWSTAGGSTTAAPQTSPAPSTSGSRLSTRRTATPVSCRCLPHPSCPLTRGQRAHCPHPVALARGGSPGLSLQLHDELLNSSCAHSNRLVTQRDACMCVCMATTV